MISNCNSENIRLFADDTSYFLHDKKLENLMNKAKQTVTNPNNGLMKLD